MLLNAEDTARHLPWALLVDEIERLLTDASVTVPPRLVQPLPGGGSLFVMPAADDRLAVTKLITFTPANAGTDLPAIQGDVVVFDTATGARRLVLDGPTVTARRTAAVSALAARLLAPGPMPASGPLLVVGAGVQGKAHLDAFASVLGVDEAVIASRSERSAQALARYAHDSLGMRTHITSDADQALLQCPWVVTCTPARQIVLNGPVRDDVFLSAVGAFTPHMAELAPSLCRQFWARGQVVVDTADASHEAGDLLQAGLSPAACMTLADVVRTRPTRSAGPVLFKSCGWAGWDLAAARTALALFTRA